MNYIKKSIAAFLLLGLAVTIGGCAKNMSGKQYDINNFHTEALGDNTYIFSPEDDPLQVQSVLDDLWNKQETNQFGKERYAVYFLPGEYDPSLQVRVGYYMQAAGLGLLPDDTVIPSLNCSATWLGDDSNHNATCNFWRGVENLKITSNVMWAVSQATYMRRVHITESLALHDNYGWASGGFLADSLIGRIVESGSQQQWLSRNCDWKAWLGENWNMVFAGMEPGKAPAGTWPGTKYTTVDTVDVIQEKPFLMVDEKKGYGVFVPAVREQAQGTSWSDSSGTALDAAGIEGKFISLEEFHIAKPDTDTAETINEALSQGKHLFFTPGIYELTEALVVERDNTILLGTGLATLEPVNGNACMEVTAGEGTIIAGLLFDAGKVESKTLLSLGTGEGKEAPTLTSLSDVFFRVGGAAAYPAKVATCAVIEQDNVVGDNFWVWRADHGDQVGWELNTAPNGILVNGEDVTVYALMVEHFQEYQTIWNGNGGKVIMYQSEIPYDVPEQDVWKSRNGTVNGYASYYVGDQVTSHEAWGIGIYSFHRDAAVELRSAMEVPVHQDVKIHNVCAIMITGNPGITHVVNEDGGSCMKAGDRQIITEYPLQTGK